MPVRREDVLDAALAVLDAEGLDALTVRKIADRLGVHNGALYWHVRSKHEVLVELAGRIVAQAYTDDVRREKPTDWREHLRDSAHRLRTAMLGHRDAARLIAGYAPSSATGLREADGFLALAIEDGLSLAQAALGGDTMTSYVTGFVLQEQSSPPRADEAELAGLMRELPRLAAWTSQKPADHSLAFHAGVNTVIAGIAAGRVPRPRA